MGKLNSLIKFVVVNVNVLLFLGGLGTIGVASFVLQADFIMLAEVYIKLRAIIMIAFGVLITAMSVIGCLGAHRQIRRDLIWSGRRILTLYQLILVAVVVGQGIVLIGLYRIEVNLDEAAEGLPGEYGEFEGRVRTGFNTAYFDQLCPASTGGESWLWSLASESCPGSIPEDVCSCSTERSDLEVRRSCTNAARYTIEECCPDEELCDAGTEAACPYSACRKGILELLLDYMTPARKYATFVVVLEGVVLILTCLLICYNPRDSTEDILIKTGALVRRPGGLCVEGAGSSAAGDAIALKLVQPDSGGGKEGTAAGSPGQSTPLVSPPTADPPSEPLRQFMTPRHTTNSEAHVTGMPDSPQDEGYEFKNTAFVSSQKKGRAAGIGPKTSALGPTTAGKSVEAVVLGAGATTVVRRKSGGARRIAGVQGSHKGEEASPGAGNGEQRKEAEQLQSVNVGRGEAMHAENASQEGATPYNAPCEIARSRFSAQTPISSPAGEQGASRSKNIFPASTIEQAATPRQEASVPLAAQALSQASLPPLSLSAQTPLSSPVLTPAGGTDESHAGRPNKSTLASSQSLLSPSRNASAIPSAIEQRHRTPRLPGVDPEIEVPAPNSIGHPHSGGTKAKNSFRFMTQTPISSPQGHQISHLRGMRTYSVASLGSAEETLPSLLSESVRAQPATGPSVSSPAPSISPIARRELHGAPPFSDNVIATDDRGPGASDRSGVLTKKRETEGVADEKIQEIVIAEPPASSRFTRFLAQAQTLISPVLMSPSPTTPPRVSPVMWAPSSVDTLGSTTEQELMTPAGAASPVQDITLLSPPPLLPASTLYLSPEPGVDRMTDGGGGKSYDRWNPASTGRGIAS